MSTLSAKASHGPALQPPIWNITQGRGLPASSQTRLASPISGQAAPQMMNAAAQMLVTGKTMTPPRPA